MNTLSVIVCNTCEDRGWVVVNQTYDWPYGEQSPCPDCPAEINPHPINPHPAIILRLLNYDWSFGCGGTHHGVGSLECPKARHHHHDIFCVEPSDLELAMCGIDRALFNNLKKSRA